MNGIDILALNDATALHRTSTSYAVRLSDGETATFAGYGFTYDASGHLSAGTITDLSASDAGQVIFNATQLSVDVQGLFNAPEIFGGNGPLAYGLSGADSLVASANACTLIGYSGNDTLQGGVGDDLLDGGSGNDSILGGEGNDLIQDISGSDTILGLGGNDYIFVGDTRSYANGNKGDDTLVSNSDYSGNTLLGGQGNDKIDSISNSGSMSHNSLNGNIGNDILHAGDGGDTLFGGQNDDTLVGGSSADWLSGDLGNDVLTGGGGSDTFYLRTGGGKDVVTDFEHDRVLLEHGSIYSVAQVGADTVISLTTGEELRLQNVVASTLPSGWLVVS